MLQPSIKQQCLNDVKLFCIVAEAAAKKPGATLMMLHRNTAKDLATVPVVNAISAYTGLAHEQILLTEKWRHNETLPKKKQRFISDANGC